MNSSEIQVRHTSSCDTYEHMKVNIKVPAITQIEWCDFDAHFTTMYKIWDCSDFFVNIFLKTKFESIVEFVIWSIGCTYN